MMYMNIAICDDDFLYMNQVKEMIEKWGKEHHEDVSIYLFNHGVHLLIVIKKVISKLFIRYYDAFIKWYGNSS